MASSAVLRRLLVLDSRRFSDSTLLKPTTAPLSPKQKSLAALSLLKSEKDPKRILSICREAALSPSSHLDRASLSLAVSSLSSSLSFSSIRSLLADLQTPPFRPHTIVLFGQAGMLDDALQTFKSASHSRCVRSLNALLFACILAKKHHEVGNIFRDFPTLYDITPNLITYNTVIKAFCESGSSRSFYSVLDEMGRKGIKPNLTTFSLSMAGFYREERLDDVKKVLCLMKKHNCHPGLSIYNIRIQSLCKLKRAIEAKELLKEMRLRGMKPNWVTYDHLIFGFCSQGDLDEAKSLYGEMGRRGLFPESSCYFSLIHYLCKGGDYESALQVCKESMERNWVPCFSIMKGLVNGLASVSKIDDAREIVVKVREKFSSNAEMWKEVEEGLRC